MEVNRVWCHEITWGWIKKYKNFYIWVNYPGNHSRKRNLLEPHTHVPDYRKVSLKSLSIYSLSLHPHERSCPHQMLKCVAYLFLPGPVIPQDPRKSHTPQQWPASTFFPLSFITYQLIGCHSIPTLRGRSLDQCCQSAGPSETSHWLLPQRLLRPGATGSPWRGSEDPGPLL